MPLNDVRGSTPLPQAGSGVDPTPPSHPQNPPAGDASNTSGNSSGSASSASGGDGFWSQLGVAVANSLHQSSASEALRQAATGSDNPKSADEKKKQDAEQKSEEVRLAKQTQARENKERATQERGAQLGRLTQEGHTQGEQRAESNAQAQGASVHGQGEGEASPEGARLAGSQGGLAAFAGGPPTLRGGNLGLAFGALPKQGAVGGRGTTPGQVKAQVQAQTKGAPAAGGKGAASAKGAQGKGTNEAGAALASKSDGLAAPATLQGHAEAGELSAAQGAQESSTETLPEAAAGTEAAKDPNLGKQLAEASSRDQKKISEKKEEAGQAEFSPETASKPADSEQPGAAFTAETDGNVRTQKKKQGEERIEAAEHVTSEDGSHGRSETDEANEVPVEFVGEAAEQTERTLDPIAARRLRREAENYDSSAQELIEQAGIQERGAQTLAARRAIRARDLDPAAIAQLGEKLDGVTISDEARAHLQDISACNSQIAAVRGPAPQVAQAPATTETAPVAEPSLEEVQQGGFPTGFASRQRGTGSMTAMHQDLQELKAQVSTLVNVVGGVVEGQAKAEDETRQGISGIENLIYQSNPRMRRVTDLDRLRSQSGPQFSSTERRMEPMRVAAADRAATFNQGIMSGQAYKRESVATPVNPTAALSNQDIQPIKQNKLPGRRGLKIDDPKAC